MNTLYNILYIVCVVVAVRWVIVLAMFCWIFWQYRKAEQEFWELHHDDILPKHAKQDGVD